MNKFRLAAIAFVLALFGWSGAGSLKADETPTISVMKVRADYSHRRPFSWYYPYRYEYYYPTRHHRGPEACTWYYYNGYYIRTCD